MTEMILAVVVALVIVLVAFGAFAYGLKCGKEMKDIPPLVEKNPDTRTENPMGNPFD